MSDCMTFPNTVEEFMEQYKIVDTEGIYMSKGAELVPIFRMRQWFEHLPSAQPEQKTAEWIEHKYECECSGCHEEWDYCDNDVDRFIYCPNCGAKMKGDK